MTAIKSGRCRFGHNSRARNVVWAIHFLPPFSLTSMAGS